MMPIERMMIGAYADVDGTFTISVGSSFWFIDASSVFSFILNGSFSVPLPVS